MENALECVFVCSAAGNEPALNVSPRSLEKRIREIPILVIVMAAATSGMNTEVTGVLMRLESEQSMPKNQRCPGWGLTGDAVVVEEAVGG